MWQRHTQDCCCKGIRTSILWQVKSAKPDSPLKKLGTPTLLESPQNRWRVTIDFSPLTLVLLTNERRRQSAWPLSSTYVCVAPSGVYGRFVEEGSSRRRSARSMCGCWKQAEVNASRLLSPHPPLVCAWTPNFLFFEPQHKGDFGQDADSTHRWGDGVVHSICLGLTE